jgi:hypothetical protein
MNELFIEVGKNKILLVTMLAWFVAQTIKVILGVARERRFDFSWFIGTGGMPSSHAAGAAALATSSGIKLGFDSAIFALSCMFALVTMFDAQGVRRSTGKQAELLNKIVNDIYFQGRITEHRLKELIGHTPIQVIMGGLLCIYLAIIFQF